MKLNELIPSLDIDILALDFHHLDTWWNFKNVNNHFSRLYYITEGEAFVYHHGKKYHLTPNTIHLIPCFSFCDLSCPNEFGHYHISFTSRLKGFMDLFNIISCDYQYKGDENHLKMFKRLMELNKNSKLENMDPYQQLKSPIERDSHISIKQKYSIADIIESTGLMRLLITPFLQNAQIISSKNIYNIERLNKIFMFIENNINNPISLQDLSDTIHIHPTYLSDFFFKMTGMRPIQYVNRKKIDMAKALIFVNKKTIDEISSQLGFTTIQYFSRVFKSITGKSPKKFRDEIVLN